jgi:hypothetical protein
MFGSARRCGVGWVKRLPEALRCFLFFWMKMQHAASNAKRRAAATTEPITMPAMAPLDNPLLLGAGAALLEVEDVGAPLAVEVGNRVGLSENCGKTTSRQRAVASEPIQHESVAFSELARQ